MLERAATKSSGENARGEDAAGAKKGGLPRKPAEATPRSLDVFLIDPEMQARLRSKTAARAYQPDPFLFDGDEILALARGQLTDPDWRSLAAPRTIFEAKAGKEASEEEAPAAAPGAAGRVAELCAKHWDKNKNDAAKFALAVAGQLGQKLHGDANAIVGQLQGAGWRRFDDGAKAAAAAAKGWLVLAGLKGDDHQPRRAKGQVAVVVKGALSQGRYPTAYWGRSAVAASKAKPVNQLWKAGELEKVVYAGRKATPAEGGEDSAQSTQSGQSGGQAPNNR